MMDPMQSEMLDEMEEILIDQEMMKVFEAGCDNLCIQQVTCPMCGAWVCPEHTEGAGPALGTVLHAVCMGVGQ